MKKTPVPKKITRKKKPLSDKYLMSLWRKAVLLANGNRCFFCSNPNVDELECHHIVHKSTYILRWDWRNGISACNCINQYNRNKYGLFIGTCHQYAVTQSGRIQIFMRHEYIDYITRWEKTTLKAHLAETGMTKEEFRRQVAEELKSKIREYV